MEKGKLLGNIISKDGIKIDLERLSEIFKVEEPRSKKEVQSFIGHVNFLRRLIPYFAEFLINLTNMLKTKHEIKWTMDARRSFKDIKQAITEAPVLVSPDFNKYFLIFSYASNHTVAGVLLQRNNQNVEQPIAFFS